MTSKSCNEFSTAKFPAIFKLFRHRVNGSSTFATVSFFTVFKISRHRVKIVLNCLSAVDLNIRILCVGNSAERRNIDLEIPNLHPPLNSSFGHLAETDRAHVVIAINRLMDDQATSLSKKLNVVVVFIVVVVVAVVVVAKIGTMS